MVTRGENNEEYMDGLWITEYASEDNIFLRSGKFIWVQHTGEKTSFRTTLKLCQLSQLVSEDNFTLALKVTSIPMIKKTEKCYGLNVRRAFS